MVAVINVHRRIQKLEDAKYLRDEIVLLKDLQQRMVDEATRCPMIQATGLNESSLIDRLISAGFTPNSVSAMNLFPIAAVAWASGSISDRENRMAIDAIFESEYLNHADSLKQFQAWLTQRPSERLMDLWEEFTLEQLRHVDASLRDCVGYRLHDVAARVALASGGFLGIGPVCAAEQVVLEKIKRVYGLE